MRPLVNTATRIPIYPQAVDVAAPVKKDIAVMKPCGHWPVEQPIRTQRSEPNINRNTPIYAYSVLRKDCAPTEIARVILDIFSALSGETFVGCMVRSRLVSVGSRSCFFSGWCVRTGRVEEAEEEEEADALASSLLMLLLLLSFPVILSAFALLMLMYLLS